MYVKISCSIPVFNQKYYYLYCVSKLYNQSEYGRSGVTNVSLFTSRFSSGLILLDYMEDFE